MPGPAITIPASYQTQDDLAFEAGAYASAHNLRTTVRNLNYINARLIHPFAAAVWPSSAPLTLYPMFWQECGPAFVGRVPSGFRRLRLMVYANVENGYSAFFQLRSAGYDGTVTQSTETAYEAVGTGLWTAYGAAWTFDCVPASPMVANVWVCSNEIIVRPDNKASVTGIISATGPAWIQDAAADFTNIPAGAYLWTTDVAGTTTYTGPFRVTSGTVAGVLYYRTTTPGQTLPAVGQYWRIYRGAEVEVASMQIRPVPRTVL